MYDKNSILYVSSSHNTSTIAIADASFKTDVERVFQGSRFRGVALLTNNDIVCWIYDKRSYLLYLDANLNPRARVKLGKHSFDKMVTLGNQFIALISKTNSEFYVEVYNTQAKKIREVRISNRSEQLFTFTLEGILVSCSRSGKLTIHNLGLEELNEPYLAIKTAITINQNFSMAESAKLISQYLGLFSQKQHHIQEIVYPKNIKRVFPGF